MTMQAPNLNFADYGSPNSDATQMFLASAQAAHAQRLQRRQADQMDRQMAEMERHQKEGEANAKATMQLTRDAQTAKNKQTEHKNEREKNKDNVAAAIAAQGYMDPAGDYNPAKAEATLTGVDGRIVPPKGDPLQGDAAMPAAMMVTASPPKPAPTDPPAFVSPQDTQKDFEAKFAEQKTPALRPKGDALMDETAPSNGAPAAPAAETKKVIGGKQTIEVGGKSYPIDPDASAQGRRMMRERRADSYEELAKSGMVTDPIKQNQLLAVSGMLRKGLIEPDKADEALFKLLDVDTKKEGAAATLALAKSQFAWTRHQGSENLEQRKAAGKRADEAQVTGEFDKVLNLNKVGDTIENLASLDKASELIKLGPQEQAAAQLSLATSLQKGILTDQDLKFTLRQPGMMEEFMNWVSGKATGRLSPGAQAAFSTAVANAGRLANDRLQKGEQAIVRRYKTDPKFQGNKELVASRHAATFGGFPWYKPLEGREAIPGTDEWREAAMKRATGKTAAEPRSPQRKARK